MRRSPIAVTAVAGIVLSTAAFAVRAQAQRPITPPLVIASLSGRDLFQFYCASCHGPGGKGDGPVAASLKRQPPDLTTIASRHEGRFPTEEIQRFVRGDDVPAAHGDREMPVWGPIFMSLEPHDRLTRVRIENVVAYVESLQKR